MPGSLLYTASRAQGEHATGGRVGAAHPATVVAALGL